jgi:hypothetical protein
VLVLSATSISNSADEPASEALYARRVGPILERKCLPCHGRDPADLKGGLDLSSRRGLLRGGDRGEPLVDPTSVENSLLLVAVRRTDPDLQMPPKDNDRLSDQEVAWVRQWIASGAEWPSPERIEALTRSSASDEPGQGERVSTSGGQTEEWTNRTYEPADLWAWRPIASPAASSDESSTHPIDAFIDRALAAQGIDPAPPADRRTLLRRVTFDLIGLPPTPEEFESFLADPEPDDLAFAKVVDRLLASPHYGEQWGRHWLDVVRHADSAGLANDYERGPAWRYRDYVVRSFNADKPYPDFILEQLAGDELPAATDDERAEHLVATGFLRMGPWELTGMEVPRVARQRYLDDLVETVGQAFLSQPLQCARCHDHKFDPIPTRDYYRFQAVFAATQIADRHADFLPAENLSGFGEEAYLNQRKARHEHLLREIEDREQQAARAWCAERGLEYVPRDKGLKDGLSEVRLPPRHVGLGPIDLGLERIARKGLERLAWEYDRFRPVALSVYNGPAPKRSSVTTPPRMPADPAAPFEPETTFVLAMGDPFSPREEVSPGALSAAEAVLPASVTARESGRRLALARWIADPHNPLAARSIVNRVWQWHFGRAIAGNPNNFGATGKKPTHPELLDWLAVEFHEQGASFKQLHRLILTSRAYRRSSVHPRPDLLAATDPGGISYAAFSPRRLEAEEIRDAMLRVSGELNPSVGGIPVRPEIHPEAAFQPRQVMGTLAPAWQPSPRPSDRRRRSIYTLRLRGLGDPFLEVFDLPNSEASCEGRTASTVSPQVFGLFNSAASWEQALLFAARLVEEGREPSHTIDRAFGMALGRGPTGDERQQCLAHWEAMAREYGRIPPVHPPRARTLTRQAVEENTGERFEFTEVLDSAGDFDPGLPDSADDPSTRGLADVCLVLFNANEFLTVD